ncbi:hypothetical protein FHETE_7086 [Fusarium heterosporum]|uniref:LysM domain-containing protein n=1 Tax=Fusarium heterosporum TaxID=42747 RepID=A0A8H5T2N4_FUSHE|nr:hypothetical protein FHETE_7086 [Fusarium heterosporum]
MHLPTLLTLSFLPQLPYAFHIPFRRGVDCAFGTSPDQGETCSSFASNWGITEDALKSLNPGITCPDIDPDSSYCVAGSVNDDEPTVVIPKSTVPVSTRVLSSTNTIATTTKSTLTQKPSPTKITSGNGIETPSPIQEGMVANCNKFHFVQSTTTCQGILNYNKISLENFAKWNPDVGKDCSNLWKGTNACVGVIGFTPSLTTTTKPKPAATTTKGNGITTPTPIQEGMVSNCNKFHFVQSTTTCQGILSCNKITMADFTKWNPAVGKDCSGLWKGTNACVGVVGFKPSPTTTTGNGIATPTPIQTGMVKNCVKFHFIGPQTTCQGVLKYNKITMAQFTKWNPAVGKDCSGLWKGTNACVAVA